MTQGMPGVPKGFTEVKSFATKSREVFVAKIEAEGKEITVEFLRSLKTPDGSFLPASIRQGEKFLWDFNSEKKNGFWGLAMLHKGKDELFILLLSNDQLAKVVPIADLLHSVFVKVGDVIKRIGGRDEFALLDLKIALSKELKVEMLLSPEDKKLLASRRKDNDEIREDEKNRRAAEKTARTQRITNRQSITVFDPAGKQLYGTPVVGSEWMMLEARAPVVLVDSYEDGKAGNPLEAFFVKKVKGKAPEKIGLKTDLSYKKPAGSNSGDIVVEAGEVRLYMKGHGGERTLPYLSSEALAALITSGVNGGTMVAVGDPDADGRLAVVKLVESGKVEPVGHYKPIEA